MSDPTFSDGARICKMCGSPLMTGFAACTGCGAIHHAPCKPIGQIVTKAFRNDRLEAASAGAKRRVGLLVMVLVLPMAWGAVHYALPRARLWVTASQTLVPDPMTMEDEFHNETIHDARKALNLE